MLTLIAGKSETGKTARMFAELRSAERVLLLDPKRQALMLLPEPWQHVMAEFEPGSGRWGSGEVVEALRPYSHRRGGAFRIVLHMRNCFREQFELVSTLLPYVGDCVFAVDEGSFFLPPRAGGLGPEATAVVVSGRHDGVDTIINTQRPNLVDITARANSLRRLIYRMDEKADLEWVRGFLPEDFSDDVPRLPNYVCIDWRDGRTPFRDESFVGSLADILPAEAASTEKS